MHQVLTMTIQREKSKKTTVNIHDHHQAGMRANGMDKKDVQDRGSGTERSKRVPVEDKACSCQ